MVCTPPGGNYRGPRPQGCRPWRCRRGGRPVPRRCAGPEGAASSPPCDRRTKGTDRIGMEAPVPSMASGVMCRPSTARRRRVRAVRLGRRPRPKAVDSDRGATSSGRTAPSNRVVGSVGYGCPHAAGARHPAFAVAGSDCLPRARGQLRDIATAAEAGRSSGERERPFPRCADGTCLRPCGAAVRSGPLRHRTIMEGTTHQ